MTSPSTSSSISRIDIFEIPVEMNLEIFGYLSPTDTKAIISASPAMLHCFRTNEQCILKPYMYGLGYFYQSLPNILLAYHVGRLYRIRDRHRFDTQEVVETQVRPVLDEIKKLNFAKRWDERALTLVQLEMAQTLVPFIRKVLKTRSSTLLYLAPDSAKAREAYIESFLLFECYTKIFYHDAGFLFTGTSGILDNICVFNRPSCGQMPPTAWQQSYRFRLWH
ncbi:uncharacterized protein B0J16DRAFT_392150 [Fusarium flagelliforme]|uniref:uncharacterized protein n=1 Tax=Fusarium flagelliforme TaxID=2675880 RepID=UPI001E8D983F|nr:uncharacterized protein B0J16DRAFT_392150 [Fusarium flagelliforme]KAH7198398.1 hypothetical protein B0J16DRAFT_392150 [Fusarium flagelliforme]